MNKPQSVAAPRSGIPKFDDLVADPEIAALLDFEPAVRKTKRSDGWSPGLQRELIARIAHCGSPGLAAEQMEKNPTGAKHLYRAENADSFREAWDLALALAEDRERARRESGPGRPIVVPGMPNRPVGPQVQGRRRGHFDPYTAPLGRGEVYNENGLPEDEASFNRRGEEARESIASKLLRCRRALLCEISRDPGKRAAFELLTELPIDWDKAARLEAQDDEPWRTPRMLEPDMVVTAENGWFGTIVPDYGPDKINRLREAIDKARAERGQPPLGCWDVETSEPEADERDATPCDDADLVLRDWAARNAEPNAPAGAEAPTGPPPSRTFGLNSQEFYDAIAEPSERGSVLPRQPIERGIPVIVERGEPGTRRK
jgi:hypothetical protein